MRDFRCLNHEFGSRHQDPRYTLLIDFAGNLGFTILWTRLLPIAERQG
jgi:hypothetical protein